MSIVVNTNIASLQAQRNLLKNTTGLNRSLERLASGLRINRAADDAAGLQISEGFRSQIRGLSQAINNAQDGNNLLNVAEGTLSVVQENLQRMRELAVQAANDTNGTEQRDAITDELNALRDNINQITAATNFNGLTLFSTVTSFRLQVGAGSTTTLDTIDIASALGTATFSSLVSVGSGTITVSTNSAARDLISDLDNALTNVSDRRAMIGAVQNRLDSVVQNNTIQRENFAAAESRIRNADVAMEASQLTRFQILQQASASILAQANQTPALALALIG